MQCNYVPGTQSKMVFKQMKGGKIHTISDKRTTSHLKYILNKINAFFKNLLCIAF